MAVYIKVAALAARPEGCTAKVSVLAGYLSMSKSAVERGLRELTRPHPEDQVAEVRTVRRTLPGGTGTSALRTIRPVSTRAERWVWIPVAAADSLTPRQLRAYAAIAYAVVRAHPLTLAELGGVLRHHTGRAAGQSLTERQVRRILAELGELGWITVAERAGYRGRHAYTVHSAPVQPALTADTDDGSAADDHDGSLAIEDDPSTGSPDHAAAGGPIRRRRDTPVARGAVDNPAAAATTVPPPALRAAPEPRPYDGPPLQLSPRVWRVLEPVRHLLPDLSPYVVRRIGREIGRQLSEGTHPERLHARIEHRYACTLPIRDVGRWILGAALPRRGCGLAACESGRIWHTGARCQVCAETAADRRPSAPPGPPSAPAWRECTRCGAPSRIPLPSGLCRPCHLPAAATSPA
ncbi:hypothetical protein [Streptomyces hygroscopicus]|uniref:hypothetical protein n=1 Tax=Streptomyces hygroscopicus TaxID=1912 RepID=UPI000766EC8F|nr:hypothetical protein [Streptomyces hygroscopicus]